MTEKFQQVMPGTDSEAAIAEFIRTRGITKCPTACANSRFGYRGRSRGPRGARAATG